MTCDVSSLPMTCDVLSFNIVRKSLQFFHIGDQLKMFNLKNIRMLLTICICGKCCISKAVISTPSFIMGEAPFWNIEISWSQWEGSACTQSALIFLILGQGWGEISFIFPLFPTCSFQVPNVFLKGVPNST
jgi:hypothetical protein